MLKRLTPLLFSAVVLSLLFLTFWQRSPAPSLTEITRHMEVDMNIVDFRLNQASEGRILWELVSDDAGFLQKEDLFVLRNPVITYFTENDSKTMIIRASHGQVHQVDNIIHLWPDVRADYEDIVVNARRATYSGGDSFIFLEDDVVFEGRGIILKSPEAMIYLDEDILEATGGVRTLLP